MTVDAPSRSDAPTSCSQRQDSPTRPHRATTGDPVREPPILGTDEEDAFVSRSVIALVTTVRSNGTPSTSMVSFARRGDRLYFTTTLDRVKGRSLARDPRCGITILNPHEPWSFVNVEGEVVIHRDNPVELRRLIVDLVDHPDYPWSRDEIEPMVVAPRRAIFELVPHRTSGVVFPPQ